MAKSKLEDAQNLKRLGVSTDIIAKATGLSPEEIASLWFSVLKANKSCEAYGRKAWRTVSESPIPMRDTYGCRLRLAAMLNNGKQKCILLSHVEPPQPGRYMSEDKEMLRQVDYF